jgi:creatinine amidohydrolase
VAGRSAEDAVREQKMGSHADEIETSMVLYMKPGAVRMERAVADGLVERTGAQARRPLTRDRNNPGGHYSPSGVFGDARLASWAKGERVVEQTVRDIVADLDALAVAPLPAGTPRPAVEEVAAP